MVALNQMMPQNPSDKDFVERTLREHPSLTRFVDRLKEHSKESLDGATLQINALAHDEWDPPLIVEVTANISEDAYIEQLHALRDWAHSDPDFDGDLITVMLLIRPSRHASSR